LVLDANILIRAVLGSRVLSLLTTYSERADFFAPDVAFDEAHEHLPAILKKRGIDAAAALAILDAVGGLVQKVESDIYATFEHVASSIVIRTIGRF
jgi:predicted nucleic acid-binding protein